MPRTSLLYFLIIAVGITFISRLFYIQIYSDKYRQSVLNSSAVTVKYDYPNRGFIYDRNGKLIVANQASYDVMVIPRDVKTLDTLEFCDLLHIGKEDFIKKMKKAKVYSNYIPSVFLAQVSKEDYAFLQEKMYRYKGFYIQKRFIRKYALKTAPNVLGYLSEVNERIMKKDPYYRLGELIGYTGVEKQYEKLLRGKKGVKYIQKNRFNKEIGPFKNGIYDTLPVPGKNISLTLDIDLQMYAEKLMSHKRGGIVAIEPSSGEIITLVSMPTYDPNDLVGRKRSKNSAILFNDSIKKPMLDRGLQAQYPPGSPFKLINGLIGLQEEVITPETAFYCHHGYRYGSKAFMKCHCGLVGVPVKLNKGIYRSCNTYFSNVYRRIIEKYENPSEGMNVWSKHVKSFGLGNYLGYDLPSGQKGLIPDADFYNRYYPNGGWRATTTISNAIGQGEVLTTPIQLANMTAAIANRGYFYTPHIVRKIDGKLITTEKFTIPKYVGIDAVNFIPIIKGLYSVYEKQGTGRFVRVSGIEICGKTGTSENYVRTHGKRIKMPDHSIFIAFAPKDNPKIALAVFIENGGYGAKYAAPIASLMVEKYLRGAISRKDLEWRMLNDKSLAKTYERILKLKTQ